MVLGEQKVTLALLRETRYLICHIYKEKITALILNFLPNSHLVDSVARDQWPVASTSTRRMYLSALHYNIIIHCIVRITLVYEELVFLFPDEEEENQPDDCRGHHDTTHHFW